MLSGMRSLRKPFESYGLSVSGTVVAAIGASVAASVVLSFSPLFAQETAAGRSKRSARKKDIIFLINFTSV